MTTYGKRFARRGGWGPSQLQGGGADLWLRGDLGITNASGKASAWADQSGKGNDASQATAGVQPVINATSINGLPGLTFSRATGTNLTGATNIGSTGGPRTVMAVVKAAAATGGTVFTFRKSSNNIVFTLNDGTPGTQQFVAGDSTLDQEVNSLPNINGTALLLEWRYQGTGNFVTFLANGVQYAVVGANLAADSGTAGYALGTRLDAAGFGWNGEMTELIAAGRQINWSDAIVARAYLAQRYGITLGSQKTRFLPRGDSITLGSGDPSTVANGGYRLGLVTDKPNLLAVGDIVGPGTLVHHGIAGQTTADMIADITTVYTKNPAEVVLLHAGTNDYIPPLTASQTATNIVGIVNAIKAIDANCKIFVALIINSDSAHPTQNALYVQQRSAVQAALSGVSNVTLVTMPTLLDTEFADGVHPNVAGYARMNTEGWEPALTAAGY